jgi:hypothetical protein
LKPSLATTGGPLVCISSPRAKRGALHAAHKRHFGAGGHPLILVAQAASRVMNPSLPQSVVDRAFEEDPEGAAAEFDAEFRSDLEQFVSREAIEACVAKGVTVRAPVAGVRYFGFCDPSGGSADSMTLAIAHADGKRVVVDCVVETRPPFSPDQTVAEFASVFRSYGVTTVVGDRYASSWPPERFFAHGIKYEASEMTHSELYLNLLPLVNSARVELLDNSRMVSQFASLERRVARSGQDSVDSPKNMHEDIANSVAGACVLAAARPREMDISDQFIDDLNALSAADRQAAWEYSRDWGTAGDFPRW